MRFILTLAVLGLCQLAATAQIPVLRPSDVVFMYQAPREIYEGYGATLLAWGETPTPASLRQAAGIKFFGSVGMVTEFSRYYDRNPTTYEAGLCRDLDGHPFKIPWLTDHQHKGVPFWWCCTRQPRFREFVRDRVVETVKAGAYGVHIDDHLGTAGSLWLGSCYCDCCVSEFRDYLRNLPPGSVDVTIDAPATFDFRHALKNWLSKNPGRTFSDHPLWPEYRIFQLQGAAKFMAELRELAATTAGHPVPMSANAGLTWGPHLNDYLSLDFFSAEIEHHAAAGKMSDDPVVAYRLADAVGRPLAATASGGDWAFIKEKNLPGLVRGWIALGYAAGNSLMAPNRQWCHTPEKGTHWYEGPREQFAPLYRFVRDHRSLFDDYENLPAIIVAYSQTTYDSHPEMLMNACRKLSQANLPFRLALGGNRAVPRALATSDFRGLAPVLVLSEADFAAADRKLLATLDTGRRIDSVDAAIAKLKPVIRVQGNQPVRLFPRAKPGSVTIHVVNWNYDATTDRFEPLQNLQLAIDGARLGLRELTSATAYQPGVPEQTVQIKNGAATLPEVPLWAVLKLGP